MRPAIIGTIHLLIQWGHWGSDDYLGYPRGCAFANQVGRGMRKPVDYIPANVQDIERAMKYVTPDERRLMLRKYQWHMTLSEIGRSLGCTKWAARRKIENAEYAVHSAYCNLGTFGVQDTRIINSLQKARNPGFLPFRRYENAR